MVRSGTTSCLKLITCSGNNDSVDRDDLQAPESKGSSDRSRWSFRKRSAGHRVLSNSVSSETPFVNKADQDSAVVSFQTRASSTIPEKTSGLQWTEEKNLVQIPVESKSLPAISSAEDNGTHRTPDEAVVIIIQSAIRRFLAQRALSLKHKQIIMLQAAVRGHIVRQHAVGSLRCVQAIAKMQGLVRQRRARLLLKASSIDEKEKENMGTKPYTYTSIEKLLSNAFARQLLESTPKTKTINIKCDPSKSDSAWKWLERWMSVAPVENGQPPKLELARDQQDNNNITEVNRQLEIAISSPENCQLKDIKTGAETLPLVSEADDNVITYGVDGHSFQECSPTLPSVSHSNEQPPQNVDKENLSNDIKTAISSPENCQLKDIKTGAETLILVSEADDNVITYGVEGHSFQECSPTLPSVSHSHEQPPQNVEKENLNNDISDCQTDHLIASDVCKDEHDSSGVQSGMEHRQNVAILGRATSQDSEIDGKKSSFVSRKASNPAFIAAQSKFEELSSAACLGRSLSLSSRDSNVDSSLDAVEPGTNHAVETREVDQTETSVPQTCEIQVGGSECGTELSISSTLDSPDRSEVGMVDYEKETKSLEYSTENSNNLKLEVDEKVESIVLERDLSYSNLSQPEKHENGAASESEHVSSTVIVESSVVEEKPESTATSVRVELECESSHPMFKSSPDASPRSHVTVPESHGTPSSQVSVKPKRIKSGKHGTKLKHGSPHTGKESNLEPNQDNGVSSSERLPKEHKSGKWRNSFGSAKPDNGDHQEPRDSSSSNSLPSYMQATESARAKALANNSPRSSPDIQDKDLYMKKRHSLSGSNTRQGSPHVQRPVSQAQQATKANGTHSPQERKWRR